VNLQRKNSACPTQTVKERQNTPTGGKRGHLAHFGAK